MICVTPNCTEHAEHNHLFCEGCLRDPTLSHNLEGTKFDDGKPRHSLIPPEVPDALAQVLTWACTTKDPPYDLRNWEKGMDWSRCFDALNRHLWKWWARVDQDHESGYSHLWHVLTNVAFLLTYEDRGIGLDNRPETNAD